MVANNEKYLPESGQSRHAKLQTEAGLSAELPENVSPHELLYYDAMVGMVNKQKKIVEREQELDGTDHQPAICLKSRQMA